MKLLVSLPYHLEVSVLQGKETGEGRPHGLLQTTLVGLVGGVGCPDCPSC